MATESQKSLPPASSPCVWCERNYNPGESHARTSGLFCSVKCEVEARFWLVARLEAPSGV